MSPDKPQIGLGLRQSVDKVRSAAWGLPVLHFTLEPSRRWAVRADHISDICENPDGSALITLMSYIPESTTVLESYETALSMWGIALSRMPAVKRD